ncbi:MAG: AsmA-like C-terminal domain-containing protein [Thermodesulfobacteriota bacterium]
MTGGGFLLWRVPLDISQYNEPITSRLEDITGASISTGVVTLRLLPAPYIEVRDIKMTLAEGELMRTDLMKFRVSILPLLLKKVVLHKMVVEGWNLKIRRDKDGEMALVRMYERIIKRKRIISVREMRLGEGELFIEDKMEGMDFSLNARLHNGAARLKDNVLNFQADLGLEEGTNLYIRGNATRVKNGKISLQGQALIEDLAISTLSTYIKSPVTEGSLSGDLAFSLGDALELSGPAHYKNLTINVPSIQEPPLRSPSGQGHIDLKLAKDTLSLQVKKARLAAKGFELSGSMWLGGERSRPEDMALSLNIETTPIALREVKSLVLKRVLTKKLAWINDFTPAGGGVRVEELRLSATLKELRNGRAFSRPGAMHLEAGLEDLGFRHSIIGEDVSGLNGRLRLTDKSIKLYEISSKLGRGYVEELSYKMDNLHTAGKAPSYELSILGRMDAGRAIAMTIRCFRSKGESTKKQLRRISATGDTRIKLNLKGKVDVKHSALFSVNLGLKGATFRHESFPLSFTSMNGNIDINSSRFSFTNLTLRDSADSSFKVEGYARDYTGKDPYFDLTAKGRIYDGTLSAFTRETALESLVIYDPFNFSSTLKGFKKALKVGARAELGSTGIEYKKLIKKSGGIPLTMDGEFVLKDKTVEITRGAITTAGTSLDIKGYFSRDKGPYTLFINSKKARLYDLADVTPLIIKRPDTAGILNIILKASRKEGHRRPGYEGVISVKNGSFATSLLKEPVKALVLSVNFDDNMARLRIPELKFGSSDLYGSLDINSISEAGISFNLSSNRFDTAEVWGEGTEGIRQWITEVSKMGLTREHRDKGAARLMGSGKINIHEGSVLGEEIKDFKATTLFRPEAVSFDPIVFITEGGTVKGRTVFYRGHKSPDLFEAGVAGSGIHLKDVLTRLGASNEMITGTLYGDMEIRCQRDVTPFTRCLNGHGHLKAERGRMWKFPVISKIFSIVNIVSIDELFKKGLPYRALTGDFIVKDGIFTSENLLFESDSMKMSAVMEVDSVESTIDATLGVHPFVTIDKIVTTIPLVGWIIGGDEKSSVSLYYSLKGPLKQPTVGPAPIKNIKEGIIGKLERLITSPIKIIQESTDMINHKDKAGKGNGK